MHHRLIVGFLVSAMLLGSVRANAQLCETGDPPPRITVALTARDVAARSLSFAVAGTYDTHELAQLRVRILGPDGDRTYSLPLTGGELNTNWDAMKATNGVDN